MPVLIDKKNDAFIEYQASYIDAKSFGAMNNPLAKKIIDSLALSPMCAIDVARKLQVPEHKVYYHLSKLQRAGIVKLVGTEKRYGMVAQLYDLVSPVIAAKLHESGKVTPAKPDNSELLKFLHPFIEDGKLNAKIIVGDPNPHGKYNFSGKSAAHVYDFILLMGTYIKSFDYGSFDFDTRVSDKDLLGNLILIGNIKENVIIHRFNDKLIFRFNEDLSITDGKNTYSDARVGMVLKMPNPMNPSSKILIIGGVGARAARTATIAITKDFHKIAKYVDGKESVAVLVEGLDHDSDGKMDSINVIA